MSGWKKYDSCYDSGYYRFFEHFEVVVGLQSLRLFTWIFVGQGDLDIEFSDVNPEVQVVYEPGGEVFKFKPEFRINEVLNPKDPVFKIPKEMKTQYDDKNDKFIYGNETSSWFGSPHLEIKGELAEPRWPSRVEHAPKINTQPDAGYLRGRVEDLHSIAEPHGAKSARVIFPAVRINGTEMVPLEYHFLRAEELRQTYPPSHCNSFLPPAFRNPDTKERLF